MPKKWWNPLSRKKDPHPQRGENQVHGSESRAAEKVTRVTTNAERIKVWKESKSAVFKMPANLSLNKFKDPILRDNMRLLCSPDFFIAINEKTSIARVKQVVFESNNRGTLTLSRKKDIAHSTMGVELFLAESKQVQRGTSKIWKNFDPPIIDSVRFSYAAFPGKLIDYDFNFSKFFLTEGKKRVEISDYAEKHRLFSNSSSLADSKKVLERIIVAFKGVKEANNPEVF